MHYSAILNIKEEDLYWSYEPHSLISLPLNIYNLGQELYLWTIGGKEWTSSIEELLTTHIKEGRLEHCDSHKI